MLVADSIVIGLVELDVRRCESIGIFQKFNGFAFCIWQNIFCFARFLRLFVAFQSCLSLFYVHFQNVCVRVWVVLLIAFPCRGFLVRDGLINYLLLF